MLGLFKKKDGSDITDMVYMSDEAKLDGLRQLLNTHPHAVLACWFPATHHLLTTQFPDAAERIVLTSQTATLQSAQQLYFAEHHPLSRTEQELFRELGLTEVVIYSALTEPLFQLLGGQKIIQIATQMGFKPHDVIENKLVSGAIANAQKKLDDKVPSPIAAESQAEWTTAYQQLTGTA